MTGVAILEQSNSKLLWVRHHACLGSDASSELHILFETWSYDIWGFSHVISCVYTLNLQEHKNWFIEYGSLLNLYKINKDI